MTSNLLISVIKFNTANDSVEEIHSVGTVNNVKTSHFTQPNNNVSMSVGHFDGATENAGLELKGPSSKTGKCRTGIKRTKIAEVENEGRTPTKH